MDKYHLDGFLGLIPVAGDIIPQIFSLVYIYVAMIKIRSIPLTIVIVFNSLLDILIGIIPYLGTILDFLFKSNVKNFNLIEAFANGDKKTIRKVNQKAFLVGILCIGVLILTILLVQWIIQLLINFYNGIGNLIF